MLGGLVLDLVDDVLDAVDVRREVFDGGVGNETAGVDDHVMSANGGGGRGGRHGDRRKREKSRAKRRN